MLKKLIILSLSLQVLISGTIFGQAKSAFSGDRSKFRTELTAFMGPNLNADQLANVNKFLSRWDSAAFSTEIMDKIINISNQLSSRQIRIIPQFYDFLVSLNYFIEYKRDIPFVTNWLKGISEIAFNQTYTNDNIDKYFKNSSLMVKDNVLSESGSIKWKVKNNTLKFLYDTAVYVTISNATLTCYTQKDSTELYNVS